MASADHFPSLPSHPSNDPSGTQYFSPEVQHALLEEDRQAWRAITGELVTIVTVGLILFAICTFLFIV